MKISRGKYLAWSSQSLIKVNWSVERRRWSGSSITCSIVPPERGSNPRRDRSCQRHNASIQILHAGVAAPTLLDQAAGSWRGASS